MTQRLIQKAIQETVIQVLNEALEADPEAFQALIDSRVVCNDELADHPTIQVSVEKLSDTEEATLVGPLGLINGILGALTDGLLVCAVYDTDTDRIVHFAAPTTNLKDRS